MKKIIGKKDKADFPELKLYNLDVKIDTGAYTSSIHCGDIHLEDKDGETYLNFTLLDPTHKKFKGRQLSVSKFEKKNIKSSNGKTESRYIISSKIVLFGKTYNIDLSLTDRGDMRYPVLIGRKLLNKKFLVDTSLTNVSYKAKLQNKKINQANSSKS